MTIAMLIAIAAAGIFAGACTYVTFVEHPARVACGAAMAIRQFGSSHRRATIMQAPLAVTGLVAGVLSWIQGGGLGWLLGGVLIGATVPFTLTIIVPVNRKLVDPQLDSGSTNAGELLTHWGRLHAVRTVLGVAAFLVFAGLALPA